MKVLLDAGADVNVKNALGSTPLLEVVRFTSDEKIAEALLNAGANVNAQHQFGQTALMVAAEDGTEKIVEVLINAGADLNIRDEHGTTVLMYAARNFQTAEIVESLLNYEVDIDARDESGYTALMHAAERGTAENIKVLLAAGADLNVRDMRGATALMSAANSRSAKELMMGRIQNDKIDKLIAARESETSKIAKLLIDSGVDINAQNDFGWTAIFYAALNGTPATVSFLLDAGADASMKEKFGDKKTAWDFAQENEVLKGTDAYWALNDARFKN